MYTLGALKQKLSQLELRPKDSLGQNFLINQKIAQKICEEVLSTKAHHIIEIGPGLGALTDILKASQRPLTLIEYDSRICQIWRDCGLTVLEQDALKTDWKNLTNHHLYTSVSNLPFQISSRLVVDLSSQTTGIESMVLMFQKEVAKRINARHPSEHYGLLSVIAQVAWRIEFLVDVGPKDFYPPPKVAAQVLVFKKKDRSNHPAHFLPFVKQAFSQRRKPLIKNLSQLYNVDVLKDVFKKRNWNPLLRPDNLSPQEYLELLNELQLNKGITT